MDNGSGVGVLDKAAVVLGANYPNSTWYHRAYRLIYYKEPRDKLQRS